jgi:hypothetical protein
MKLIELDQPTTKRCVAFGHEIVRRYAAGLTPQSRAFSSHGAESNVELQIESKMAECIFAVSLGLPVDPLFGDSTRSWDVQTKRSLVDVKQTGLNGRYLIWPLNKNEIFASKRFDLLALVKNRGNRGAPVGWITKQDFALKKLVAGERHKLTSGTWHVGDDELMPMSLLPGHEDPIAKFFGEAIWRAMCEADRDSWLRKRATWATERAA